MSTVLDKKKCSKCSKEKKIKTDFYISNSPNHADGRLVTCKACFVAYVDEDSVTNNFDELFIKRVQDVLLEMNRPFIYDLWEISIDEAIKGKKRIFGTYLKNIFLNYRKLTWLDSVFTRKEDKFKSFQTIEKQTTEQIEVKKDEIDHDIELDERNKVDVLRMLGYDPFEGEVETDKRHLYNKLVDFLDESTLEDSFKLPAVIEIVKSFNQLDKINLALSKTTADVSQLSQNSGGITTLINAKKNMLKSILDLAQENGISVKHNTTKSKGAGTLSGIIKQLQERGFEEAEINSFDIDTAMGIKQVADLSNKSIREQLQFDENDYTEMILEQRELISEYRSKAEKLEEEVRKLKKQILEFNKSDE